MNRKHALDYSPYSGWRGGIGIAFSDPAAKIRDVSELGLDIVWGHGEPKERARFLDLALFRYFGCASALCLKDRQGRFDFSGMPDKEEAARLAFDKWAELTYGASGLSKFAQVQYAPGGAYGDVTFTFDLESDNPLAAAVIDRTMQWFAEHRVQRGGVALDNAGKVPESFLKAFHARLREHGLGIATNGCPEHLLRHVDFFGNEKFPYSPRYAAKRRAEGFRGILGEFPIRHLPPAELEMYLKVKLLNGIVFFGYTDDFGCSAASVIYSFYHSRPDVYNPHRRVLRRLVPLSRALLRAGREEPSFAATRSGLRDGGPEELVRVRTDATGSVLETGTHTAQAGGDVFNGTLAMDGSVARFGRDIGKGIYLLVNSPDGETVTCDSRELGIGSSTVVWDEFAGRVLETRRDRDALEFDTPCGPALLQLGDCRTLCRSLLNRLLEMFATQQSQRRMDAQCGVGYPRRPWTFPDDVPRDPPDPGVGEPLRPWEPFCQGYVIDRTVSRSGKASLRATVFFRPLAGGKFEYDGRQGAVQFVNLDHDTPRPLVLRAFSRSEQVPGSTLTEIADRRRHFQARQGNAYCVHLYLDYEDGSWPEVHTMAFSPGTHDWEERTLSVSPSKPVRTALVAIEFHQSGGCAWFDDLSLDDRADSGKNLLVCAGFEVGDVLRADALAGDYERRLDGLLEELTRLIGGCGRDGLAVLGSRIAGLKRWLVDQDLKQLYGREWRDAVHAARQVQLCAGLLAGRTEQGRCEEKQT